ncbi:hypothetical protein RD792_017974 [Penstemon davidsonii]|uniref:Telomerase reverse transcriptase n=1 Tax=Penstemon davidsonii TaxID=160366 RepID=A0ABR0DWG9_9LAMI|nr:hypothetical protein RD792_017974 [Penstemon davidsonii]
MFVGPTERSLIIFLANPTNSPRASMAKKRQRVPEVLWTMFQKRARTLRETILDTAVGCRCNEQRCLCCGGDQAMSLLLRPKDPSDYRTLLSRSFVVVDENAPPPPLFDPHSRWPQREVGTLYSVLRSLHNIVRRSIETILFEEPSSSNILCDGYDKGNRSSAVVDMLTSSAWTLLLSRIGDALMMYLLKYTSLFLLLPGNKHHQIAGFPISDLCCKFPRGVSDSKSPHQPLSNHGLTKKRKRIEGVESISGKQLCAISVGSEPSPNYISFVGSNGSSCVSSEEISLKCEESPKPNNVSSRKHKRQYRWQRHRKHRELAIQETCSSIPYNGNCSNSDNFSRRLQDGSTAGSGQSNETGNDFGTNLTICGHDGARVDGKTYHVANAKNGKIISEANIDKIEPIQSYCPKKQVVSFIWAICRRIIPSPLLGTHSNWRILRKNISKFIQLRRFEKFSLKECMHKLKLSKFPLLSHKPFGDLPKGCSELGVTDIVRHEILECWIFWLFARLVSPLIQANFYVTESEHEKQEVLYYPKSTWEKLMKEAEKCLMDQRYSQLNHSSVRGILKKRLFGFSRVRLRPKQIGFRVLANLRAPSKMRVNCPLSRIYSNQKSHRKTLCKPQKDGYEFFNSVNSVLQDLHVVLKGSQTKEPDKLGSSVFDYNDVYRKLVPFLFLLKNGSTTMPGVFIVVSDVKKAFDSINQEKLLSVMKDVIQEDEYTIDKIIQVIQTKGSLKVHHHLTLAHQNNNIAESSKIRLQFPAYSLSGILVKQALSRIIRNEELHMILKEHITRNVVQLHNNFYLQNVGIPQGSVLSTLLCSYYYDHMERNVVFPYLRKAFKGLDTHGPSASGCKNAKGLLVDASKHLLLRFIDDFLFISTSKEQASMFFSRLERGVRDYNCYMNEDKYGLNFKMNHEEGRHSSRLYCGKDSVSFLRWSGLLLNCCTLEIQADYTRYLNFHLSSTLTISRQGKVGHRLKTKLCDYLRPKCHPIFYDSNINSAGVVRLNIYQAFLLCSMKFICYISNLSPVPRFSPKFYFNAIIGSLRYMNRLIKRKIYSFKAGIAFRPKYDVKKKEILWLGLYAYSRVLKKKQSQHKELLRLFMSELKSYGKLENMSSELKYAIDDAHSSPLWNIRPSSMLGAGSGLRSPEAAPTPSPV